MCNLVEIKEQRGFSNSNNPLVSHSTLFLCFSLWSRDRKDMGYSHSIEEDINYGLIMFSCTLQRIRRVRNYYGRLRRVVFLLLYTKPAPSPLHIIASSQHLVNHGPCGQGGTHNEHFLTISCIFHLLLPLQWQRMAYSRGWRHAIKGPSFCATLF